MFTDKKNSYDDNNGNHGFTANYYYLAFGGGVTGRFSVVSHLKNMVS